jgi:ketosteroid isomerase-like protein
VPYSHLPEPIRDLLAAIEAGDAEALHARLAPDAAFYTGEGDLLSGAAGRAWFEAFVARTLVSARPTAVARRAGGFAVTLPARWRPEQGGDAIPRWIWRFVLEDGRIARFWALEDRQPPLPPVVAAHIWAINSADLDGVMRSFHDAAMVCDQLREVWGKDEIRRWAEAAIIGDRLSVCVVGVVTRLNQSAVTVQLNGRYEKRGMPDPLVAKLYFSLCGDLILQLIILRIDQPIGASPPGPVRGCGNGGRHHQPAAGRYPATT